jgi:hypothetical protein
MVMNFILSVCHLFAFGMIFFLMLMIDFGHLIAFRLKKINKKILVNNIYNNISLRINILFINNFRLIIMIFRVISKCISNLEKGNKKKKKKLILPAVWPIWPNSLAPLLTLAGRALSLWPPPLSLSLSPCSLASAARDSPSPLVSLSHPAFSLPSRPSLSQQCRAAAASLPRARRRARALHRPTAPPARQTLAGPDRVPGTPPGHPAPGTAERALPVPAPTHSRQATARALVHRAMRPCTQAIRRLKPRRRDTAVSSPVRFLFASNGVYCRPFSLPPPLLPLPIDERHSWCLKMPPRPLISPRPRL